MFYILLMLTVLLPALAGIGTFIAKIFKITDFGLTLTILCGIFCCTMLWTVFAFFFPLNIYLEILTIIIGIFFFFYLKNYLLFWRFFSKNAIPFLVISCITIFFGSYYPFILDHFGYYVPSIKWLSEVGLVKGISNLDLMLGQMSLWHVFQAGFSHFADPFLRINVLVLIIYTVYIFEKTFWVHLAFFPVLYLLVQSPSPDLPVIVFSLIILNEIFTSNKNAGFLLAFSVFVFAIKPTVLWLPLFTFLYFMFIEKISLKNLVLPTLVMFLFLFKNIWTFGFPIFPVQFLDFGLAWKPNAELLKNSAEVAVRKTFDAKYSYAEIQHFLNWEYFKKWLFLGGIKGNIHILFVLSLIGFFVFAFLKKSRLIWFLFISVLIKSVAVFIFSAQYRFFIEVFFVLFFVLFFEIFTKKLSFLIFGVLSIFVFAFLTFPLLPKSYFPSFKLGPYMSGQHSTFLVEPAYFKWTKYKSHQIGNLQFHVVDGYIYTFESPLPAITPQSLYEDMEAGIFPQLKGKTLKNGFIWRKISPEEKEKLRLILQDFE
ncbi:hypothetical protein SAMN05421638_2077 [Kaistella treverensis]|uniref:DUF8201 domain-containing protein n=1 Tax=Kaistella treverensis TaxID=631455 RepID=A0A1I3NHG4_9FLAO|nr:hypothetical protein [Kaistella treverensis]SFJ08410.1 hypothetical protein SAMN05421638_2077 [Kaistella treverensis]